MPITSLPKSTFGGYGKSSDGGLFTRSILRKSLEVNTLNIPNSKPPPNSEEPLPFVTVGDEEAFPLKKYLLRPYPGISARNDEIKPTDCKGHDELLRMLSAFSVRNLCYFMAELN